MRCLTLLLTLPLMAGCGSLEMNSAGRSEHAVSGHSAPLQLRDLDGGVHDVSRLLESEAPVVLVFWQTWCASCIREAPAIAHAARKYDSKLHFFGVVPGPDEYVDEPKVREVATRLQLPYPQCRDREATLTKRFEVKGTPTIVVLGKGGKVLYEDHHTPKDWSVFLRR